MANMDRPKKMLVRTAFVTGTTVATLVGAQTLALIDQKSVEPQPNSANEFVPQSPVVVATPRPVETTAATIIHAAPSIVILREPGQVAAVSGQRTTVQQNTNQTNTVAIQPPAPVQLSAPAPIVVQQSGGGQVSAGGGGAAQPPPVSTRSSR